MKFEVSSGIFDMGLLDNWHLSLRFGPDVLRNGMDPLSFIRYLGTFGRIAKIVTLADTVPASELAAALYRQADHPGGQARQLGEVLVDQKLVQPRVVEAATADPFLGVIRAAQAGEIPLGYTFQLVETVSHSSRMPSSPTPQSARSDPAERIRLLEAENAQLRQQLEKPAGKHAPAGRPHEMRRKMGLRSILDHLPAMVGYWDKNLHNCFSNQAYQTWFGLNPKELAGKHIREVIGEERYRLNLPYIEGALRGEQQQFERTIPRPDGSGVRHSLANYIPDIVDGKVRGFYVLVTETTALHDAHEALRASEERYRAMIEDQTELIARFTTDGRFTFVNKVYCRFFGKRPEELLDQAWHPVCHPDDVERVELQLGALSPANPSVLVENRIFSGSGEVRWMQFANRGFFDEAGRLVEIQSVGRDVTERKQAEQALQEAHDLMEQRIVERTEQLRRLGIEKALAEDGERQAIARDLHDGLGQLLHVAKIRLDAVTRQLPAGEAGAADELTALLAEASRQVRSLTSQLSPPVLHKLGLLHALHWLGEEMDRLYGLKVEVSNVGPWPPLAPAQASILFRSARELLINAAKHSGCKLAHLAVVVTTGQLALSVEDDGVGIDNPSESLNTTQGFGLASIRERLTYLGGSSEILTAPGQGLRVTLRMPLPPDSTNTEVQP